MPEFEVKYEIREPVSRNQRTGNFKYTGSGSINTPITVSADDESEARKKAAKHPKVARDRARVNAGIPDTVQDAGGKARFKIKSVRRGRGGGGDIDLGRMATGTDLPRMRKMRSGGAVSGYDMPLYQSTVKSFLQANDGGSGKRRK